MNNTINERQRRYRAKMYKAGFKPLFVWVERKETMYKKMTPYSFMQEIKKITTGWESEDLSRLLHLFIRIAKSKKKEAKLKK